MARLDVNIQRLYALAFGYLQLPAYSQLSTRPDITRLSPWTMDEEGVQPPDTGVLGAPIHLPCTLGDMRLPNEPLIELSAQKRIVMTDIDGQDGSFKELYSNGDMRLVIRGVCVYDDRPDEYPEDQVRALRNVLETRKHVPITNRLTAMWNVEFVAVESYSFPAVPGELGMQAYEIIALSDREFALSLRDGQ